MYAADPVTFGYLSFSMLANYTNSTSAQSPQFTFRRSDLNRPALVVRGPFAQPYLTIASPPPDLAYVKITFTDFDSGEEVTTSIDATNIATGVTKLSTSLPLFGNLIEYQLFDTNGGFGEKRYLDIHFADESHIPDFTFIDARSHLKENLKFLLRSATITRPFSYAYSDGISPDFGSDLASPEFSFARPAISTNYEFYGLHQLSLFLDYSLMDNLRPIQENYLWRNFVFNETDPVAYGFYPNDAYSDTLWPGTRLLGNPSYYFTGTASNSPPVPLAFNLGASSWVFTQNSFPNGPIQDAAEFGVTTDSSGNQLPSGIRNVYGLPIDSVLVYQGGTNILLLEAGHGPQDFSLSNNLAFYSNARIPDLKIVDYYFASQTPHFSFDTPLPPLPGSPDFSVTNTSPLLITSVGQPITVSGWAKMAITNGYPDKFAYLEQYFDKAYKIDANGNVTTNETGILSPYGEFFPTEPGQVALVTMADIDNNQRGTGVVNVIKLQLDVNHDTNMDLSFAGPDNTSADRPFKFWINNDHDQPGVYGNSDEDIDFPKSPDFAGGWIKSQRDLEDYARLWICGLPALTNGNYQVALSWANISSGNPSIELFNSVEANGGTGYLTDTNIAAAQINTLNHSGTSIGTVTNGTTFTFPASYFTNFGTKYLLFEGAGVGKGELVLTVLQDNQPIASTSTYIELKDVQDMYERAQALDVTAGLPPSSLVSRLNLTKTLPRDASEAKQMIVFVHGINNTEFSYESTSESMFKRLYWAGYQGRFAAFRWPCAYLPPNTANPFQYNKGEFYAWKSASAFKDYLTYLRNNTHRLPGYSINIFAHSQGNVVASEALQQGAPFDNYILTQGAIPAHCYDPDAPFLEKLLLAENSKPTPFYAANGGYHDYFANLSGNLISFYNTNDFALASGTTLGLQTNWEENQRAQKPESFTDPDIFYAYNTNTSTSFTYTFHNTNTVQVTDPHEIKSMVARSRSKAVGAQEDIAGIISSSVDLKTEFGFGNTRDEHSGQFNRNIQAILDYYGRVIDAIDVP